MNVLLVGPTLGPTSHAFREGCEHLGARRFRLEMVMRARPPVRAGTDHFLAGWGFRCAFGSSLDSE